MVLGEITPGKYSPESLVQLQNNDNWVNSEPSSLCESGFNGALSEIKNTAYLRSLRSTQLSRGCSRSALHCSCWAGLCMNGVNFRSTHFQRGQHSNKHSMLVKHTPSTTLLPGQSAGPPCAAWIEPPEVLFVCYFTWGGLLYSDHELTQGLHSSDLRAIFSAH